MADERFGVTPNLYPFSQYFNRGEEHKIVDELAIRVELCSNYAKTIRQADKALFADRVSGPLNLYLVLCAKDTPEGIVTELTDDMVLIRFGPYIDGLRLGVARASRGETERLRMLTESYERSRQLQKRADRVSKKFLSALTEAIVRYADEHADAKTQAEINAELDFRTTTPDFDKLTHLAAILDVSIVDLVLYSQQANES